jgi:hypothetical protein
MSHRTISKFSESMFSLGEDGAQFEPPSSGADIIGSNNGGGGDITNDKTAAPWLGGRRAESQAKRN